jgi:hypothetical protein
MTDRILYHHRTRGRNVEGVHIRAVAGIRCSCLPPYCWLAAAASPWCWK